MHFLAPYMLWGGLAAGIPIALHFFFRSRYRRVPWAAMKFLLTSIEQTSRRLKFQEMLLLLARVALLLFLALALSRPSSFGGKGSAGDAVDAVFLIDISYSMDARDGPVTRLESAKTAARAILDHLPLHSTLQIIACADRANLIGPRVPSDLDQARQVLQSLEIHHLATDLLPGVKEAALALERSHSPNKEFYLFSDMQKLGWEPQAPALTGALQEIGRKATVYLARCGSRIPVNVSVTGIVPQSGIPHTGERAGFAILVRNTGSEPARNLTVSLAVDGDISSKETQPIAEISPGETRTVTLTARLERPGPRILTATVKPDELEADNRFDQVIFVRDQVRILVVDGGLNEKDPEKSASFYLMHALMPVKDTDKAKYHIQPRLVTPQQAAPALLGDKDLCILVNVALQSDGKAGTESLGQEFIDALASFVRAGHGLILFAGDHVIPKLYNQILYQQLGLLPQRLSEKLGPSDNPVQLDRNSAESQFFSLYRTDENYKTINGIEIRRYLEMAETSEPDRNSAAVQVILRYGNGRPAILTRKVDAGEVMLVTTTADLTWTDWPLWRGMYLPFLDLALNHLLHRQTQHYNQTAGQPLNWYPPEREGNRHYVLIHPDGRRARLGMPERVNGRPVLTATDTPRAGLYRVVPADGPEMPGVPFAVVPDPLETESLETLTDSQLDDRLGFKAIHLTPGGDTSAVSGGERWNREWTPWLLAAVLAVAVGESVLAWFCGRAR